MIAFKSTLPSIRLLSFCDGNVPSQSSVSCKQQRSLMPYLHQMSGSVTATQPTLISLGANKALLWRHRRCNHVEPIRLECLGLFTPSISVNTATTLLAILFSLKTMKSLQKGIATHFQSTPLFSMRKESLASLQSCRSVDTNAWCNGQSESQLFFREYTL